MVTSPVAQTPVAATVPATSGTSTSGSNSNLGLGSTQLNTQDFISILTAQLQYQDPLNPVDPNQFVGEMAQFGSLNELIGIKQALDQSLQNSQTTPTSQSSASTTQTASNGTTGIS